MDTFVDSSWYYLRYLDVNNESEPFSKEKGLKLMPVDVYIGGIEHAMTHLFVSRLISHFFYEQGYLSQREPFKRFVSIGMVKGDTFKTKSGNKYVPSDMVVCQDDGKYLHKETGEELKKEFEKMSKSKMNGVDPQTLIQQYGVDFTRFFLLSFVHPKSERNFSRNSSNFLPQSNKLYFISNFQQVSSDMVDGTFNTFQKIWTLVDLAGQHVNVKALIDESTDKSSKLNKDLHKTRNSQLSIVIIIIRSFLLYFLT